MNRSGFRSFHFSGCKVKLDVRNCVELREQKIPDGSIIYLSVFHEEIDARFNKFLNAIDQGTNQYFAILELTDAVFYHKKNGEVKVFRGGSCTFPLYWNCDDSGLIFITHLPIADQQQFSRKNLVAYFSNVYLQSSYEPNTTLFTPLNNMQRIRRGAISVFTESGFVSEEVYLHQVRNDFTEEQITDHLSLAYEEYGKSQQHKKKSVLELSGGFDSTLAAAAAPRVLKGMQGISVEFPYYEFRFEADAQKAVSNALGIKRIVHDGTLEFPYAPVNDTPRFDEPTIFVTGLRHAERVAKVAAESGANYLYIGHGGDQLFCTNLLDKDPVSPLQIERGLFSGQSSNLFKSAFVEIKNSPWLQRATGCFVYDACIDVWMKEVYGLTVRTPFTDLAVFIAAFEWSHWCEKHYFNPDKSILVKSMGNIIPDGVLKRKGKVAYDGVWMRAYEKHGDHIASQFEKTATVLEYMGLSPAWLLKRVKQMASWQEVSTKEVLAAYAVSYWLLSHNITRPEDVNWAD